MSDKTYWLSTEEMTVMVTVRGKAQVIITTPPIIKVFKGQVLTKLIKWMQYQKGFEYQELI